MSSYELINGDMLQVLDELIEEGEQVEAVVTDPPYELGFMGRQWDATGIAFKVETWRKVLEVLRPGAHLLAFGGTKGFHRMAVAIEDAGFEIRDTLMWVYGSGFPKSLDVSKAIDKAAKEPRKVVAKNSNHRAASGVAYEGSYAGGNTGAAFITAPATEEAAQWEGWGTALKPAYEPIIMARKPLKGTVAQNVLEHRTGAINIDACRIAGNVPNTTRGNSFGRINDDQWQESQTTFTPSALGRWPANLIHDGSAEVVEAFPEGRSAGNYPSDSTSSGEAHVFKNEKKQGQLYADKGSAARFFYCAKASSKDREEGNNHLTVKPTDLMRYLCRLITPPQGIILDPFMGSGSTGKAAMLEGFLFCGIEQDAAHFEIATKRIERAQKSTMPMVRRRPKEKV